MKQPHIVMLLSNPFRPDPRVLKEARSLVQHGYKVTVLCWDRLGELSARENIEGITIQRLVIKSKYSAGSRQALYLPRFWMTALGNLKSLQPDVIHCHDLDTALIGYLYTRAHNIPWILDAHECYPEQMKPQVNRVIYYLLLFLERFMSRKATHLITVGDLLAKRFKQFTPNQSVVGNYALFVSNTRRHRISKQDFGIQAEDLVVVYIGGFTMSRAILPLIYATNQLTNVAILLVGDGPQRAAIESELPTHPQVKYVGYVPQEQVPDYTTLADVIYYGLNTNDGNSQYSAPNALFNALIVGKPLLTTNVGEIAKIVKEENCGIVIDKATPNLIAKAVRQLANFELRTTLSQNSQAAAKSRYNWFLAEKTLLKVYNKILNES